MSLLTLLSGGRAAANAVEPPFTGSLLFDGVDEGGEQSAGTTPSIADNLSLSFWVKAGTGNFQPIISQYGAGTGSGEDRAWHVIKGDSGFDAKIMFLVTANNAETSMRQFRSSIDVFDNTWHHVVCTFQGSAAEADRVQIYVDGVRDTSKTTRQSVGAFPTTLNTTAIKDLTLAKFTFTPLFFAGNIASLSVYSGSVLSQSEVDAIYALGLGVVETSDAVAGSLEAYYRMGNSASDNVPTSLNDESGNGRTMGLLNMELADFDLGDYPGA